MHSRPAAPDGARRRGHHPRRHVQGERARHPQLSRHRRGTRAEIVRRQGADRRSAGRSARGQRGIRHRLERHRDARACRCRDPGGRARDLRRGRLAPGAAPVERWRRFRAGRETEARPRRQAARDRVAAIVRDGIGMPTQAVLVTGAAGFIGFHVAQRLLAQGRAVVGVDSVNDYYDPALKQARLALLSREAKFTFVKLDLADRAATAALFAQHGFAEVVHLAAQAGVRYSLQNPHAYVDANLQGFINVLEGCRHNRCRHLLFASSSSVYGANKKLPFSVHDNVDHPVSLYAASKKANELMAHSYSHLFRLPTTGLRFFTVYGPWGRPDMAMFIFTKAILEGRPIDVFNHGKMRRDFTFVDDIAEGIMRVADHPAQPNPAWSGAAPDPATSSAP